MRALGVVTDQTRLQKCGSCGETVRAMLVIYYTRTYRPQRPKYAELVRGRAWSIIPGTHRCESFFNSIHPTRKES